MKPEITEWKEKGVRRAFLVGPAQAKGPMPLIVWLHSAVGSAEVFLDEASVLSGLGAISLLLEAPYSRLRLGDTRRGPANPELEIALWQQSSIETSMAVDKVVEQFEIDFPKSAAVGQNLGGSHLAHWLTHDSRIRSAITTGSVPQLSLSWENPELMRRFDLTESVSKLPSHRWLFQFGYEDDWIKPEQVGVLSRVIEGRSQQKIEWLSDGHEMKSAPAVERRLKWLMESLP